MLQGNFGLYATLGDGDGDGDDDGDGEGSPGEAVVQPAHESEGGGASWR